MLPDKDSLPSMAVITLSAAGDELDRALEQEDLGLKAEPPKPQFGRDANVG